MKTALEITTCQSIDPKVFQSQLKYYIHSVGQQNQNDFIHEKKSKYFKNSKRYLMDLFDF